MGTVVAFVTLFVFTLIGEAVTFRMVEDPPSPPPHAAGGTFRVDFVIDASDIDANLGGVTIVAEVTPVVGKAIPKNDPPFTLGSYLSGFITIGDQNKFVGDEDGGELTLAVMSFTGVAGEDDKVMASVEFVQTVPGPVHVEYTVDSKYSKVGLPGSFIPVLEPIDVCLPVELSSLTVNSSDVGVVVKWRTESELNNLGFDIYRSENPDGKFVKVNPAYIKGAGTDSTPHDYKFVDESAVVGKTYYYYIESISFSGERERSHIIKVIIDASGKARVTGLMQPAKPALLQNFPNPFNPETWIPFHLADNADVTIRIFDIRGKQIRAIHLGRTPAGYYETRGNAAFWDGRDSYGQEVSSGIYFYNLTAGTFSATKKLTIIK
jgi:hypothetical protein